MTISETPVIQEFPVRRPAIVPANTFFATEENRHFLLGRTPLPILDRMELPLPMTGFVLALLLLILGAATLAVAAFGFSMVSFLFWIPLLLPMALLFRLSRIIRQRVMKGHLEAAWSFIEGTVTSIKEHKATALSATTLDILYEFTSPQGDVYEGVLEAKRFDKNSPDVPAVGTPVYVLYFGDNEHYLL